jgi:hypothetical protein
MVALVTAEPEESLLSPGSAPGVLDDPIVGTTLGSITNSEDSMVEARRATKDAVVDACNKKFISLRKYFDIRIEIKIFHTS